MGLSESSLERALVGIAHALFINRLHVLRLTEVVRLHIEPDAMDSQMILPPEIDNELKQQAIDFVLTCFPREWAPVIHEAKEDWLRPA